MPTPMPDEALVRLLQQTGLITNEQLAQARAVQMTGGGAQVPLGEACVQLGILTHDQYRNLEMRYQKEYGGAIEQLGQYRLMKKIGEGGMGSVYLAEDTMLGRQVAIKVLPESVAADPVLLGRFKREAIAAGKLNHANIAAAFAFGSDGGRSFYVMEFCEGESLDEFTRRLGRLPEKEALQIAVQVAQGLQYAHDHSIIHRDVKPANVVVTPDGVAKILDLGLSKNLADTSKSSQTMSGVTVGTPDYISPEQARGTREIDGRVDIYALGGMLYYLVTGQPPFTGDTAAVVMVKHLTEPLEDPRLINHHLTEELVLVLMKAMAKSPDDRYQKMAEMIEDLQAVLDGRNPPHASHTGGAATGSMKRPASGRRSGAHSALVPSTSRTGRSTGAQTAITPPEPRRSGRSTGAQAAVAAAEPRRSSRMRTVSVVADDSGRRRKVIIICGVVALLLLLLGLWMAFSKEATPSVAANKKAASPPEPTRVVAPPLPPPVPPPVPPPEEKPVAKKAHEPEKNDPPAKPASETPQAQETKWPVQLMTRNRYFIDKEDQRALRFSLKVPAFPKADCELAVGVTGGVDDTADKGMYVKLLDADGKELLNKFCGNGDNPPAWFTARAKPNSEFTLILEDQDTEMKGKYPGNNFTVEVWLRP